MVAQADALLTTDEIADVGDLLKGQGKVGDDSRLATM